MSKKGFTLVELLAVIVILAIILAIAIPSVSNVISNSKANAYTSDRQMMVKAVKNYIASSGSGLPSNIGDTTEISLSTLQLGNYVSVISDPSDKSKSCNGYILVTKTSANDYSYNPFLNCNDGASTKASDNLVAYYSFDDFEEPTTNLWNGNIGVYNNLGVPYTFVATGEIYKGATVYRLTMTPTTQAQVDSINNNYYNQGVRGSSMTYLANTKYTDSIYFKAINISDVTVRGTASNIGGWNVAAYETNSDGWTRAIVQRDGTVITDKTDNVYWSFKSPSFTLGQTIIIDWVAPQIEQKDHVTPYISGTRTGNVIDYSGNGNNVALANDSTTPQWVSNGKSDGGYQFDGIDDFISVPINKLNSPFTISLWAFRSGPITFTTSFISIAGWRYISETIQGIALTSDYKINYKDYGGSPAFVNSGTTMNAGTWYQIVATYDGSKAKIYNQGNLANTLNQTPYGYTSSEFQIGADKYTTGQNRAFYGIVDNVKIYNRALSADEINYIYQSEK